jgi:hypothetical protein
MQITGGGTTPTQDAERVREAQCGRDPAPPDPDGFGISVACTGERWRVRVSGRVDAAGASALVDIAEVLAARGAPAVDLDLSEVTTIDAGGWSAASYAEIVLAASGVECRLVSPPSRLNHPSRPAHHVTGQVAERAPSIRSGPAIGPDTF